MTIHKTWKEEHKKENKEESQIIYSRKMGNIEMIYQTKSHNTTEKIICQGDNLKIIRKWKIVICF